MRAVGIFAGLLVFVASCSEGGVGESEFSPPEITRENLFGSWACSGERKSGASQDYSISFLSDGRFTQSSTISEYTDDSEELEYKISFQGNWNFFPPNHLEQSLNSLTLISMTRDGEAVDMFTRALVEGELQRRAQDMLSTGTVEFEDKDNFETSEDGSWYICSR